MEWKHFRFFFLSKIKKLLRLRLFLFLFVLNNLCVSGKWIIQVIQIIIIFQKFF